MNLRITTSATLLLALVVATAAGSATAAGGGGGGGGGKRCLGKEATIVGTNGADRGNDALRGTPDAT